MITGLEGDQFTGLTGLESLSMKNVGLSTLTLGMMTIFPVSLDLSSNPLRCDCSAKWLWKTSRDSNLKLENSWVVPACTSPIGLEGKHLLDMPGTVCTVYDVR